MKIVLNRCYGGFALSGEQAEAYGIPEEDLYKDGRGKKTYYDYDLDRTDPKLVEVVEMGLPNSWASDLQVVEIPDNSFYRIEEHDGSEYIIYSESEIHFA
jgi:hypothetical protein